MTVDVAAETLIRGEREAVAAYAVDPANDTSWIGGIKESLVLSDGGVGKGARVARTAAFLGRRIEYVNEIVEYEPGHVLSMRSVKAPFPMAIDYRFEDADGGGTRVSINVRGEPGGFFRIAGPLLGAMVRRNVQGDLGRLKRILESGGAGG